MLKTMSSLHQPLHSKVTNYLNNQRQQGQFCDLILELDDCGESIFAHYCVVAAQSEFIGGFHLLQKTQPFSIQNPLKITIKNFNCLECLQTIADFFYEDMVSVVKEHLPHFKQLAEILIVDELLKLFMKPDTASLSAPTLTTNVTPEIKSSCSEFVLQDSCEIQQTLNFKAVNGEQNEIKTTTSNEKKTNFKLKNTRVTVSNSKINYCFACDFKCYRVQEMIEHMRNCEPSHLTCSLCETGFLGWREYDAHLTQHDLDRKRPFFCLECDMRFVTRAALNLHHPKHSKEAPFVCNQCGKSFKWKHGLRTHLLVHNTEKLMLCDICGYCTTHLKALKSHKLQHTGEFFKCPHPGCHHQANRKENLKLHIETHKQERPFVCEICGGKFSLSKNLKRHAMKHLSSEISKKYKCQLCLFSSHRSDKLKEHVQRMHTEKLIQLELPEVVENSFERKLELEEFQLPNLFPNSNETLLNVENQSKDEKNILLAVVRKRKSQKSNKALKEQRNTLKRSSDQKLKLIAPKVTLVRDDVSIK